MKPEFKIEDCRPFNLAHARQGAPIIQRSGEDAGILKFDCKGEQQTIIGYATIKRVDNALSWTHDGFYLLNSKVPHEYDLFMAPLGYCQGRPVHVGDELLDECGRKTIIAGKWFNRTDFSWPIEKPEMPTVDMSAIDFTLLPAHLNGHQEHVIKHRLNEDIKWWLTNHPEKVAKYLSDLDAYKEASK